MADFLRNKDESRDGAVLTLKCDQKKRNGNMESTVWKYTVKSILHII